MIASRIWHRNPHYSDAPKTGKLPPIRLFGMRTNPSVLQKVGRMYLAGYTRKAIVHATGLHFDTVRKFIRLSMLSVIAEDPRVENAKRGWQFVPEGKGSFK